MKSRASINRTPRTITWLSGGNAYAHAANAQVVRWELKNGLSVQYPVVATGKGFADVLGGSVLAGTRRSVIVLADSDDVPGIAILKEHKAKRVLGFILGGTPAISSKLAAQISTATGAGGAVKA